MKLEGDGNLIRFSQHVWEVLRRNVKQAIKSVPLKDIPPFKKIFRCIGKSFAGVKGET